MNTVVTSKDEIFKNKPGADPETGLVRRQHPFRCGGLRSLWVPSTIIFKSDAYERHGESVWCKIFHEPEDGSVFEDTLACISWMYGRMEYGQRKCPGFFTLHSLGFLGNEKSEGRQRMQETWKHISDGLIFVLKRDPRVRPDAFTEQFPAEKFADVLFSLMLSALLRQDYDPRAVLEITRRTLY